MYGAKNPVAFAATGLSDTLGSVRYVPATLMATAYAARCTTEDGQVRVIVDPCGRVAGFTFRDEDGRCMWRAFPGYDFDMGWDAERRS